MRNAGANAGGSHPSLASTRGVTEWASRGARAPVWRDRRYVLARRVARICWSPPRRSGTRVPSPSIPSSAPTPVPSGCAHEPPDPPDPAAPSCSKCYGVLLWDSAMMARGEGPRCRGLLVSAGSEPYVPSPADMSSLVNFKYACVGKSLFLRQRSAGPGGAGGTGPRNITRVEAQELPDCRFWEVVAAGRAMPMGGAAGARAGGGGGMDARRRTSRDVWDPSVGGGVHHVSATAGASQRAGGAPAGGLSEFSGKVLDKATKIVTKVPDTLDKMGRAMRKILSEVANQVGSWR